MPIIPNEVLILLMKKIKILIYHKKYKQLIICQIKILSNNNLINKI